VNAVYACHLIGCFWFYVGDPTDGWIKNRGVEDESNSVKYLTSFYWAITVLTTVGFGDIGPSTPGEMIFSCFAEMAGCFIFAILMGSVSAMLTGQQILHIKVAEQMGELTEYLRKHKITPDMRTEIRNFMEVSYSCSPSI
jgi:hypothetical protein